MGKIFCLMGKSASGKDTIYSRLLQMPELTLKKVIPYTTRPMRQGEIDGDTYFFCGEDAVEQLEKEHRIIELRAYDTVHGIWKYFTADDGQIDPASPFSYLMIGTLEAYGKIRDYFGAGRVIPLYIQVDDVLRLERALEREKQQQTPDCEEMCRRFLADARDFSEEKLQEAKIKKRFENTELEQTLQEISAYIKLQG